MSDRPGLFAAPRHTVLSLNVQTESAIRERDRSQFEVLVRHLIYRFFHNELLASDDETKRVMLVSYAATLPSFVLTLFLYFIYHFALPPMPYPRPFWSQIGDHYFFVMYSFLIMGAAAVYEWDLLFPNLLDVFVLSVLPISTRRLFFARVLALTIFLGLVLVGTSILGTLSFPVVADLPRFGYHLLAHALSVLMSGTFAAASFFALQGILLNTVGQHIFRRITPLLQGGSMMLLLAVLLFYPAVCHSIIPLLTSDSTAVRCFPPFWFLGIYERILQGPSALPIFSQLARTACSALLLMLSIVLLTYPLAYRRRVRQLIEGAGAIDNPSHAAAPLRRILHTVILRHPAQRAVFHFVSQTILRTQRQRVMLGMYGDLALAVTISNMVVLHIAAGHLRPSLLPYGIRTAVPIMAFWTIVALSSIVSAPIDRRCSWLFHAIIGRPGPDHLAAPGSGSRYGPCSSASLQPWFSTPSRPPNCGHPSSPQDKCWSPSASRCCLPTSACTPSAPFPSPTCAPAPSPTSRLWWCATVYSSHSSYSSSSTRRDGLKAPGHRAHCPDEGPPARPTAKHARTPPEERDEFLQRLGLCDH